MVLKAWTLVWRYHEAHAAYDILKVLRSIRTFIKIVKIEENISLPKHLGKDY